MFSFFLFASVFDFFCGCIQNVFDKTNRKLVKWKCFNGNISIVSVIMNRMVLSRFATITSISIGSFFAGLAFERHRCITKLDESNDAYLLYAGDRLKNVNSHFNIYPNTIILKRAIFQLTALPALPIFGTVSAATAFVPDVIDKQPAPVTSGNRVSQIMKYGFPGLDNVRSYSDYVLSYDRRNRVAHWVFEHLTAETVKTSAGVNRAKCDFKPDETIHPFFRYS